MDDLLDDFREKFHNILESPIKQNVICIFWIVHLIIKLKFDDMLFISKNGIMGVVFIFSCLKYLIVSSIH